MCTTLWRKNGWGRTVSSTVIDTIQQTINGQCRLRRQDRNWIIPAQPPIAIRAPHRHSIAFSLDDPQNKYLAFFDSKPPRHLAKMCDALAAVWHADQLYLFAIEVKTGNKDDANKQIANGQHFWAWLEALLKEHGYLHAEIRHIDLLIWKPRIDDSQQLMKREEALKRAPDKRPLGNGAFSVRFEAQNISHIQLLDLIKQW